jgi:hypothetical protein
MRLPRGRAAFTIVEMLIAMIVGLLVLTLASQIVLAAVRSLSSSDARSFVDRQARFVGLSLQRDLQEAGVDLESSADFGSVHAYGDTLAILRVPYDSTPAVPSREYPSTFATRPGTGLGTCGAFCLDLQRGTAPFEPRAGDVVLLQVANQRRLLVAGTVATGSGTATLTWPSLTGFLGRRYGLRNPDVRLDAQPLANIVRRVEATVYFRRADSLMRATAFEPTTGAPQPQLLATGVSDFRVFLHFADGDSAATANSTDADGTNDPDDVTAVSVTAVLQPDPRDIRRGFSAEPRTVRWFVAPRNLAYEKNRI